MKKYLFVVAHLDDEVLGAGAFIYDAIQKGDEVYVFSLNSSDATRYKDNPNGLKADLSVSHSILGITKCVCGYCRDGNFHLENHRHMVQWIEKAIRLVEPDVVFTHHPGDINTDHYWTAISCIEAFRVWQRGREDLKPIEALYLMEVQSSTDWALNPSLSRFEPNTYVEVSAEAVEKKIEALACYEGVVRPIPHPRSEAALTSLPLLRGAQAGVRLAEAFQCVFRKGAL